MIAANDLRVDNWLNYDTGEGILPNKIDWQDIKWAQEDNVLFNKRFTPIQLTEEVLLKSEFIKSDKSNEYWDFFILPNNWILHFAKHAEPSAGVVKGCYYWSDEFIEIKNFHCLQNLYYCLSGKELNYQP